MCDFICGTLLSHMLSCHCIGQLQAIRLSMSDILVGCVSEHSYRLLGASE